MSMPKLKYPTKSHPGRAGRKPARLSPHTKKFRAPPSEWEDFILMLTGDATNDFIILYNLLLAHNGRGRTWVIEQKPPRKEKPPNDIVQPWEKPDYYR
jgi:hypothetical protein